MRKLQPRINTAETEKNDAFFQEYAEGKAITSDNKEAILKNALRIISTQDKYLFYPLTGRILELLGYNCSVTRDGDTNNRSDAYIIDGAYSIPIEIKSPTEIGYINNKSVRQALENKIVLLSRGFYKTTRETTSLAIGYTYPADRSGVLELIEDIHATYHLNVGIISLGDLLENLWDMQVGNIPFDKTRVTFLKGPFQ